MAHIRKENKAEPMADFAIYIILSPFDEKKFYIGKTTSKKNINRQLHKAYTKHVNCAVTKTKTLFQRSLSEGLLPPIYHLETVHTTTKTAFKKCVAWTKYFLKHGYEQDCKDVFTEYADDLAEETRFYYSQIANLDIENIVYPAGGLFPNYKIQQNKTKTKKIQDPPPISIYTDKEEYAQIKKAAEEQGLSLSAYCKKMALNGRVLQVDLTPLANYMEEFTEDKDLLKQIIFNIYTTGNYYSADLKNIQAFVDHLSELQDKAHQDIAAILRVLRE